MYERHFGISGLPFQLSPDPAFFFDGSQHFAALAALRRPFSRELPFVVLSGDIGAGKTTVLRTWLAEVEASGVAVAQLTNTQLDPAGLLDAIATAFGIDPASGQGDGTIAALRPFLRGLEGASAVLAIDEAQNLERPALKCLVELAHAAVEEGACLRIVLAGQPELRVHVADATLPELQAWVQHACHLAPLDPAQTRQYIEHRLSRVGWQGTPSFDASVFDAIHALTGGIPRRINVLANRLLLAQFLNGTAHVDERAVTEVAQALDAELGEGLVTSHSPHAAPEPTVARVGSGAILLLASGRSDYIKSMALMAALDQRRDLPPAVIVGLSESSPWRLNAGLRAYLGWSQRLVALADETSVPPDLVEQRFRQLIERLHPSAVLVFDGDALSYRCAVVARDLGVALAHVGSDLQVADEQADPRSSRAVIGRIAGLRFNCQVSQVDGTDVAAQGVYGVGNLLADAIRLAGKVARRDSRRGAPSLSGAAQADALRGYGVIALQAPPQHTGAPCAPGVLPLLRELSRDLPLVWPMRRATMLAAHASGLARTLEGDRIARIEELGYVSFLRLAYASTCVLTDSPDVMEETAILGVPCLSLGARHARHVDAGGWLRTVDVSAGATRATRAVWQVMFGGASRATLPPLWDGNAGVRIAECLAGWLEGLTPKAARAGAGRHPLHANGLNAPNRAA